jgi:spore coat polysaccharide biosynthesis protein SpsF (cytidylyltransferase family)
MICALVQARMTSTRLPGKVLADIGTETVLGMMLSRVRQAKSLDLLVVATTTRATDDPVAEYCRQIGVQVYRGDEMDVLGRLHDAAYAHKADVVVRLTADCPFADPAIIDAAIDIMATDDWDYVSNCTTRTYPDGLDVEVMTMAALSEAAAKAKHPFLREHVTPYINGRRLDIEHGDFALGELTFDADFSHIRWTVDTPQDLDYLRQLAARLPTNFGWLQALAEATKEPLHLGAS